MLFNILQHLPLLGNGRCCKMLNNNILHQSWFESFAVKRHHKCESLWGKSMSIMMTMGTIMTLWNFHYRWEHDQIRFGLIKIYGYVDHFIYRILFSNSWRCELSKCVLSSTLWAYSNQSRQSPYSLNQTVINSNTGLITSGMNYIYKSFKWTWTILLIFRIVASWHGIGLINGRAFLVLMSRVSIECPLDNTRFAASIKSRSNYVSKRHTEFLSHLFSCIIRNSCCEA